MNQNIENVELLKKGLADFSIQVDDLMVDRFEKYRQVLVEYISSIFWTLLPYLKMAILVMAYQL